VTDIRMISGHVLYGVKDGSRSAGQEIPCLLQNQKFHYRGHIIIISK